MAQGTSVEQNEAFIDSIIALEAQIRTPEDVAFAVRHFSNLLTTKKFPSDFAPALNDPLPTEFRDLVGDHHTANECVVSKLMEHGGFDPAYGEVDNGQNETEWRVRSLVYKNRKIVDEAMDVYHKQVKRSDGTIASIPYVSSEHYMDLFNSMMQRQHLFRDRSKVVLRELANQLEVAIATRQTVHGWHELLPVEEDRVKEGDHSHGAFLGVLKELREAISQESRLAG